MDQGEGSREKCGRREHFASFQHKPGYSCSLLPTAYSVDCPSKLHSSFVIKRNGGFRHGGSRLLKAEQAPEDAARPRAVLRAAARQDRRRPEGPGAGGGPVPEGAGAVHRRPVHHLQERRLEDAPVLPGDGLGQHGPGPVGQGTAVLPVPDGVQPVHGELWHRLPEQAEHPGCGGDLQGGPQDRLRRQQLPDIAVRGVDAVLRGGVHLHLAGEHQAEQDLPAAAGLRPQAQEHQGRPGLPGGQPVPQDAAGPAHAGRVRVHDTAHILHDPGGLHQL